MTVEFLMNYGLKEKNILNGRKFYEELRLKSLESIKWTVEI